VPIRTTLRIDRATAASVSNHRSRTDWGRRVGPEIRQIRASRASGGRPPSTEAILAPAHVSQLARRRRPGRGGPRDQERNPSHRDRAGETCDTSSTAVRSWCAHQGPVLRRPSRRHKRTGQPGSGTKKRLRRLLAHGRRASVFDVLHGARAATCLRHLGDAYQPGQSLCPSPRTVGQLGHSATTFTGQVRNTHPGMGDPLWATVSGRLSGIRRGCEGILFYTRMTFPGSDVSPVRLSSACRPPA
jgi:hypothetical protein